MGSGLWRLFTDLVWERLAWRKVCPLLHFSWVLRSALSAMLSLPTAFDQGVFSWLLSSGLS